MIVDGSFWASKQTYFLDFKASPRIRTSNATKAPIMAAINGNPSGPIGCSIRAPIKYPINAVRSIPIIPRSHEALSGVSGSSLTEDSLV